jgi:hypothetical protein
MCTALTALAAMALAHLDPYRRSRRDAARALARTARSFVVLARNFQRAAVDGVC